MANLRLVPKNLVQFGEITASPALVATLPETFLQQPTERSRPARTTSLAAQTLNLVWAANQRVNFMGFGPHNLTASSSLRGKTFSDVAMTATLGDTGATSGLATSGLATLDVSEIAESDMRGFRTRPFYVNLSTTVRAAQFVYSDAGNPDGYMDLESLWIGEYFEFAYNPPHGGVTLTPALESSQVQRAADGTPIASKGWRARRLEIDLALIAEDELDDILAILNYLGTTRECFVDLYPGDDSAKGRYHRFIGRVVQSPSIGPKEYGLHESKIIFEES